MHQLGGLACSHAPAASEIASYLHFLTSYRFCFTVDDHIEQVSNYQPTGKIGCSNVER